jgi:hypothetical protein
MPRLPRTTTAVRICAAALAASLAGSTPLSAQAADSAAIVSAVQRLFDAMAQRDTAAARALLAPGSRFVSILADSGGGTPRVQSDTAFLRSLARGQERLLERFWAPVVQQRGPIATVWAPYDFHVDGRRTHCGVDAFTLVRTDATWRIAGIAYTVERRGCPDSPLGPPR